ncbi:hypothetical protein [Dysgonomonas sp. BGC7]|uniref:hypothetical protein n=1 Tax=Dysgonomonas sp. BGC7 TaxID=1658008 RepID=UPI00067FFC97|nr:hypothetical protein [Dysgonomonas sp. BGC7]MBD8387398.1 hypothetical protein [Dysgonomonas sp. BGC7]
MKRTLMMLLSFLYLGQGLYAQKENYNWLFSRNVGLTWKTTRDFPAIGLFGTAVDATLSGIPTEIPSSIYTHEGCFAISDVDGNLLFYSNGITIWDKNGTPMPNANGDLTGHSSSSQSGVIVPYPGDNNKYIAFTLGANISDNLSYSIIDMTLRQGLGDVMPGKKNILISIGRRGMLGETLTAVRHSNREDFWIVAVGRGLDPSTNYAAFLNVWKVDKNGVQHTPHYIVSVGSAPRADMYPNGYIVFSPNGSKFAWNCYGESQENALVNFVFGEFDNSTGKFGNRYIKKLGTRNNDGHGYGVAFSKNGKYLYLTSVSGAEISPYGSNLTIYDIDALLANPTTTNPINTFKFNPSFLPIKPQGQSEGNPHLGAIGLAPDGRMYIPQSFSDKNMYVIDNPDDPTNIRIYKLENIITTGNLSWGLPTAAAPWFRFEIIPLPEAIACFNHTSSFDFQIYGGEGYDDMKTIVVDFGDGKPNSIFTFSPDVSPLDPGYIGIGTKTVSYTYDKIGTYNLSITAYDAYGVEMQGMKKTALIKVRSCLLPINPNIHQY